MAECYYEPTPATDGATMNPVPGAVFQVFEIADTTFSTPLSLRVGAGNPTTTVTASESLATLPGVWVTSPNFEHIWKSGTFEWRRDSIDGAKAAIQDAKVAAVDAAASSDSSAQSSADSAQAARDAAALVDAPADTVMAGVAGNPDSQFATQLNATTASQIQAEVPALTADIGTGHVVVFLGDSNVQGSDTPSIPTLAQSWPTWTMLSSDGRWEHRYNAGVASQTTAQMLARVQSDVIDKGATVCIFRGGGNDASGGTTVAQFAANVTAIHDALKAEGIKFISCLITPRIATVSVVAQYNDWLTRYAAAHGLPLLDHFTPLVDPATGGLKATYDSGDGTHFSVSAGVLLGQLTAASLESIIPEAPAKLATFKTDSSDLLTGDGLFLVENGTTGRGENWGAYGAPAGSTASLTTDPEVIGKLQRITNAGTASSAIVGRVVTGWSAGDVLEVSGLVSADGGIESRIRVDFTRPEGNITPSVLVVKHPMTRAYVRHRLTVPSGTTAVTIKLFGGSGTGWVEYGQVAVRNVTAGVAV